jgi:hypothetical protein
MKGDPLYTARRTLHAGADLLMHRHKHRLTALFADDRHVEVEATRGIYQRMIAAYRHPYRPRGRAMMARLIDSLKSEPPLSVRLYLCQRARKGRNRQMNPRRLRE